MFSGVTLPGTGDNVLQPGRSGIFTMGKDILILTVDKQDDLFSGKKNPSQGGLTKYQMNIDQG